jgi:hypothetical protein
MLEPNVNQNVLITVSKINGENCSFPFTKTFKKEVVEGDVIMKFILTTDRYASETRFYIYKPDGTILLQGGPWPDLGNNGTTVREFDFIPPTDGCYRVEVTDSYGDGINAGYGAGNVKILNSAGTQIYYNDGKFGSKLTTMVTVEMAPPPPPTYLITATAGENGTINPIGEKEYEEGESATYTFTPDTDYEIDEVLIDGVSVGNGTSYEYEYTFTNINADHTIRVTFKLIDGIKDVNGMLISIAPNPVNDKLFVTGVYDKLEIISISGQVLTTIFNQPTVDVTHLAKGLYFIKIQSNNQTRTFKIVK